MNIIIFSTDDNLGAGKAALRMTRAFQGAGHNCRLVVKNKTIADDNVIALHKSSVSVFFTKVKNRVWKHSLHTDPKFYFFGYGSENINISRLLKKVGFQPDIIIITWISRFISPSTVYRLAARTSAKIIAYPMDMSILTGGCHYAWDCKGYTKDCCNCPAIEKDAEKKLAHRFLNSKLKYWKMANVNIIAPSEELLKQAEKSKLFSNQSWIPKILLPIDESVFNADARKRAKAHFNITEEKFSILFGASFSYEERKGLNYFIDALKRLKQNISEEQADRIQILIVGKQIDSKIKEQIPFNLFFIEYITRDENLSLLYQAADVFVSTCIQDSGPMMINESILCGTPVVAFNIGVAEDLIVDDFTGMKVKIFDVQGIADGIRNILLKENRSGSLNEQISIEGKLKSGFGTFNKRFIEACDQLWV